MVAENPYLSRLQELRGPERKIVLDLPDGPGLTVGNVVPTPYGWRTVSEILPAGPLFPSGVVLLMDGAGNVEQWAPEVLLRQAEPYTQHGVQELWTVDPSPAVGTHGLLWGRLLGLAYDLDGNRPDGVFAAIRGVRCWGADVEWTGRSWRLVPGEIDGDDWTDIKERYLRPNLGAIKALLGQVGES